MFENYLKDPLIYLKLEQYFHDEASREIEKTNIKVSHIKFPFYNTKFNNGMPFMDGNPIFSAINLRGKEVIRIIISEDVNKKTKHYKQTREGRELVVTGNITDLSEIIFDLRKWIGLQRN